MKALYYLSPNLVTTKQVSDDLHEVGVSDWFLHVISKDEAGLRKERIHSSNYLETLDLIRDGLIGANVGFIIGALVALGFMLFEPFGPDTPAIVYFAIVFVCTMFGAWEGGLIGIASENKKLRRFHDEIEAGKYVVLIYAVKEQEELVREMMRDKHPESRLVAVDRKFMNPFAGVQRRRRRRKATAENA